MEFRKITNSWIINTISILKCWCEIFNGYLSDWNCFAHFSSAAFLGNRKDKVSKLVVLVLKANDLHQLSCTLHCELSDVCFTCTRLMWTQHVLFAIWDLENLVELQ